MENRKKEISKFYEQIFSDTKLKEKIVEKAKAIVNEEDLKRLIQQEIMPLMKKFKVNFSEEELLKYEEETLKKLSEEDLFNVSGGVSVKSALLAGGLLSVGLLSGAQLSPTTYAMQVENVSASEQDQSGTVGNSQHHDSNGNNNGNDNGNNNTNDNENAGNSTNFEFNLQDAHYAKFGRLMNNAGNQLHDLLKYFEKNGVKAEEDILDFLENLKIHDPESFERLRSDVSHLASQIGQFGQDKILIGKWLSDNRFLPEELQFIENVEQYFKIGPHNSCGQKVYWLFDEKGTLTIFGKGNMRDYAFETFAPWYKERYNIKNVVIKKGVTSIGAHAFQCLRSFKDVDISDSVNLIGEYAFCGCKLTHIKISKNVTSIKNNAFSNCGLKSVELPDGIISIGDYAFAGNPFDSIKIPESVTFIGQGSFKGCENLESIAIPHKVTTINGGVFNDCHTLKSVTLYDGITSIGHSAFRDCESLEHIDLPKDLIHIEKLAFMDCRSLKSIYIPKNVNYIGYLAFANCKSLKSIDVDKNNPNFTSADGVVFSKPLDVLIVYPEGKPERSYDVPNSVKSVESGAFFSCGTLEKIDLPKGLNSIGMCSFDGCKNLKNVVIPDEVVSIGKFAFSSCHLLTSISIPENVDFLGQNAFSYCYNIKYVELNNVKKFGNISESDLRFRYFGNCANLEVILVANPND